MVVIALVSEGSEENLSYSEMTISIDSVQQLRFVDTFLSELLFQNLFWFLLVELSLYKPQKP